MAEPATSPTPKSVDITVAGYLLTPEMLKHLCILKYGYSEAEVEHVGPVDAAAMYYNRRRIIDAPCLLPVSYHSRSTPNRLEGGWLLTGKAAFFHPTAKPPELPLDDKVRKYLNHWFPPELLQMEEFKEARYMQMLWPRDIWPRGVVMQKMRMRKKAFRDNHKQQLIQWVLEEQSRGVSPVVVPPRFPTLWLID